MKRSTAFSLVTCLVLIPATLYLGVQLPGRWYYFTSTLILIETMLPFFFAFETRKPQARELVLIAVMCALSVAGRVAILLPNFKPMTAIIMLTGIALGPEAGFITGAISAFASNFFYSQGPWTPWQMMAYGIGGFLAGLAFYRRLWGHKPAVLTVFGFSMILLVVGPLLDACTFFTSVTTPSWKMAIAVLMVGFPMNLQHGAACGLTMLLLSRPMLQKLERVIVKYGMMEVHKEN